MGKRETIDEAYERLRREGRLSEQIADLQGGLDEGFEMFALHPAQVRVIIDQLRELRARRIAMGREPDDEANAPADMCVCNVNLHGAGRPPFDDGCPLHPRPERIRFYVPHGPLLRCGAFRVGYCTGCECPHWGLCVVVTAGPRLRCGAFCLRDCAVDDLFAGGVDCAACEPALTPPF
jgi:hypothetical protein